jgi:hypothetical protein
MELIPEVFEMRVLLLLAAMMYRGGIFRMAAVIFLGFCLLALGAVVLGH